MAKKIEDDFQTNFDYVKNRLTVEKIETDSAFRRAPNCRALRPPVKIGCRWLYNMRDVGTRRPRKTPEKRGRRPIKVPTIVLQSTDCRLVWNETISYTSAGTLLKPNGRAENVLYKCNMHPREDVAVRRIIHHEVISDLMEHV